MQKVLPIRSNVSRMATTQPVLLVQGSNARGEAVWHFVQVEPVSLPLLQRESKMQPMVDVTRYGKVLASGVGAEPYPHVVQRMKAVYGYKG